MKIDLDTLTDEQLDKPLKLANIAKINAEIDAIKKDRELKMADLHTKIESMSYNNAKVEAERAKMEKEMRLYPWIATALTIITIAAMVVAAIAK